MRERLLVLLRGTLLRGRDGRAVRLRAGGSSCGVMSSAWRVEERGRAGSEEGWWSDDLCGKGCHNAKKGRARMVTEMKVGELGREMGM